MKQIIKISAFLVLSLVVFSCNSSKKKDKNAVEIQKAPVYSIATESASVLWTAYKFTSKLGVSGTFNEVTVSGTNEAASIDELLKQATMTINTESVNSNLELRDAKLRESFFKVFNTPSIKGSVLEAKNGEGVVELQMNTIKQPLAYTYSFRSDTLVLAATLDLNTWNGKAAMQSLNKECYDLHKGTDGISKLWPDVDIQIKIPVNTK